MALISDNEQTIKIFIIIFPSISISQYFVFSPCHLVSTHSNCNDHNIIELHVLLLNLDSLQICSSLVLKSWDGDRWATYSSIQPSMQIALRSYKGVMGDPHRNFLRPESATFRYEPSESISSFTWNKEYWYLYW